MIEDTLYTDLITSEHADKPNYFAMVALTTQPMVDQQNVINAFSDDYDLELAIGNQLDVCGLWIGISRFIKIPIIGFFFSFDILGQGFDEAPWFTAGSATFRTVRLDDPAYRRLLQAKAVANRWDGTMNGLYEVWDVFFRGTPNAILIHDNQNMTFSYEVTGTPVDDATAAIVSNNYILVRPAGVLQLQSTFP